MSNGCCNCIEASATVFFWDGNAEQAKFTEFSKQFDIELLFFVVLMSLRFNEFLDEVTNHFSEHLVFFTRICKVDHGLTVPTSGFSLFDGWS